MEKENSSTLIGPTGLIGKHEFVRVIIECIRSLGYERSASCLESESGISCKIEDFQMIRSQIMEGDWDGCIKTIASLKYLTEDVRSSALFLVFKQWSQEYMNCGDISSALDLLRNDVTLWSLGTEKVHRLAYNLICPEETNSGEPIREPKKNLLMELEKLLPPPTFIPDRRLEQLDEIALVAQLDHVLITIHQIQFHLTRITTAVGISSSLKLFRNEVWFVQFSNNGKYLASSSCDCSTIIWKVLEDGKASMVHILQGHNSAVSFVTWNPDDTKLLTCGNLEVLKLWDVDTGTCKHSFGDEEFIISSCAWFSDSKRLVCGCSIPEKGIRIFNIAGKEIRVWKGPRIPKIMDLAVASDGKTIVCIFSSQDIRIFNLETGLERVISEKHQITSISISRDSRFFIVNLNSKGIHLWDMAGSLDKPLKYVGHEQEQYVIRSCFGGYNCSFIASGSENSKVYIWNRNNSRPIEVLSGHKKTVNCISWNPKRHHMLASASDDHTVRIWGPSHFKNIAD